MSYDYPILLTVTSACSRNAAPQARPQIPAPTTMILSFSWVATGIVRDDVDLRNESLLSDVTNDRSRTYTLSSLT